MKTKENPCTEVYVRYLEDLVKALEEKNEALFELLKKTKKQLDEELERREDMNLEHKFD